MGSVPALLAPDARPLSQTEQAYEAIKRLIIELHLPPGSQFTEGRLAAIGGTSKTPVREALVRLQRDGLVEAMPRSGYRVAPVTLKDTRDLCEFRSLLECECAERAAARAVPEADLKRMRDLLRALHMNHDVPANLTKFLRLNFEFDMTIARASGNDRLVAALAQLFDEIERVLRLAMQIMPWSPIAAAERQRIYDALAARDGVAAREAMRQRTQTAQMDILNALLESASINGASIPLPAAGGEANGGGKRRAAEAGSHSIG
jgi:GntR family transcriptional regulator, rspAB operon transcriptional repressor